MVHFSERLPHERDEEPLLSPSEKTAEQPAPGSQIPGAQNPDSVEVKQEKSPNTE